MKFLEWVAIIVLYFALGLMIGEAIVHADEVHAIKTPCADCLIASYECEVKALTDKNDDLELEKEICLAELVACSKVNVCEAK